MYFGSGQIVVLAVKPQQLREVVRRAGQPAGWRAGAVDCRGRGRSALSRWLDGHERIVRIMPNTPAMIGKGVAGLYAPRGVDEQDRDAAQRIMAAAGSTGGWMKNPASTTSRRFPAAARPMCFILSKA